MPCQLPTRRDDKAAANAAALTVRVPLVFLIGLFVFRGSTTAVEVGNAAPPLPADAKLRLDGGTDGADTKPALKTLPSVRGLVFSPDGKLIATRGEPEDPASPRLIRLWDAKTGRLVRTLEAHDAPLTSIRFSPDGRFLAAGQPDHGAGTQVWDVTTGRRVIRLDGGRGRVHFLPGSRQIAVVSAFGINDVVRVHDVGSGKEVRRFVVEQNYRYVFSPDGEKLLSLRTSGRTRLRLTDLATGKEAEQHFEGCTRQPTVFAFSPDGRTVAAGYSQRIGRDKYEHHVLVWEVATFAIVHDLTLHTKRVLAMSFSPDGRFLATGGIDRGVKVWELATGKLVHTFSGHQGPVGALDYSPDGRLLASGSFDKSVIVWDAAARARSFLPNPPPKPTELAKLWADLGSPAPAAAYRAIGRITAANVAATGYLQKQIHSILVPSQNNRIHDLIAQLDDDDSLVRQQAMRELRKLRKIAMPILLKKIHEPISAEVRYRLRLILGGNKSVERFSDVDDRRMLRIIHAAERVGGEDAEKILELIIKHYPHSRVVNDAEATLNRLKQGQAG